MLTFIAVVAIYFFAAYTLSQIPVQQEENQRQDVAIYIMTNGVHTDVVVPVKNNQVDWRKEVKFSDTAGKDTVASYVSFGWGDKAFYLQTPSWADLKPAVAFHAAFGLSESAIHTTYYRAIYESATCKKIWLSNTQYARLINYLQQRFKTDASGHVVNIVTNAT